MDAVQQELWRRLANAYIQDADDATLEAQQGVETLRIEWMLDATPALREQVSILDLMQLLSGTPGVPRGIETYRERLTLSATRLNG